MDPILRSILGLAEIENEPRFKTMKDIEKAAACDDELPDPIGDLFRKAAMDVALGVRPTSMAKSAPADEWLAALGDRPLHKRASAAGLPPDLRGTGVRVEKRFNPATKETWIVEFDAQGRMICGYVEEAA